MFNTQQCIVWLMLSCLTFTASAKNIGVIGQTYPIQEQDFLQTIQQEMQQKVQSGEWAKWQAQQTANLQNYADRPTPVDGLTPTLETRTWFYDPTLIVPYDIRDTNNRLIAANGSQFNPLDILTWTYALIFYDGDNPQQVAWVQQMDQEYQGKTKLILVNGSVKEQMQHFQKRVYFDQGGHLISRLNITHIPALVVQEGKQLKITEVKL
ncbi:MAG TPA: type-F conjugative transfer system protein TraW [Gammaproteobacteria bacterium]|nr:type-F conjugative transfer system protein TraW [Gammaproteobacteria bacterium]